MLRFLVLLLSLSGLVLAVGFEYPYLYRDYRALGMGNVYNAVGGSFSAVFFNPAGLSNLREEEGFYVNLLPATISVSTNVFSVADDIRRALESKDDIVIFNTIKKYRGEVIHGYASLLPSVAVKKGKVGFGAGLLIGTNLSGILHHGGGTEGLYEVQNIAYGGPLVGLSYDRNRWSFGGSIKYLYAGGINDTFRISEVTAPDFDPANYLKYGSDFSLDLGLIYRFKRKEEYNPRVGFSLMNITDIRVPGVINIPMTANVGFAMNSQKNLWIFKEWTVGIDYVDLFMAYRDKDILKRIRIGAEGKILSGSKGYIALRGGIYGGQLTAGVEFNLLVFTLAYTTYAEEMGGTAFQFGSRRHLVYLNVGW